VVPSLVGTPPRACATCRDGGGWVRWCFSGQWIWAACADCNRRGRKPKPAPCPRCHYTRPFCACVPPRRAW